MDTEPREQGDRGAGALALGSTAPRAAAVAPPLPLALVAAHDGAVRSMIARTLELLGFVAITAADAADALALVERHIGALALLVTDVEMPGLPGSELARASGAARPRLPVLFISTERAARELSDAVVGRPAAFLTAPFSAEELRRAVHDLTR